MIIRIRRRPPVIHRVLRGSSTSWIIVFAVADCVFYRVLRGTPPRDHRALRGTSFVIIVSFVAPPRDHHVLRGTPS